MDNTIVVSRNGQQIPYLRHTRQFTTDQVALERMGIDPEAPAYLLVNEDTGASVWFDFDRYDPDYDSEYMDGEPYDGQIYRPRDPRYSDVTLYVVDRYHLRIGA